MADAGPPPPTAATPVAPRRPGITAVVLTGIALVIAWQAINLLVLLFIAILVAVYLAALTDAIEWRTRWRRPLAFTAAIAATLLIFWGIEALLVPPVVEQVRQLAASLPRYVAAWQDWLGRMVERFPALEPFVGGDRQRVVVDAVIAQAEEMAAGIFPQVFNLVHGLINVVSVAVMAIYFARSPRLYTEFSVGLVPPPHRGLARDVIAAWGVALRQWVFAQIFNMAVLGALTALGLWALDVPYWLAFGIFAGLAAIVPFFGTLVSTIVPALFVLDRGPVHVILVLLLGVVVHVIEGNFIAPMVFERGVKLPPVLTIMSILVVGTVVGPVGLLVAVPLLAVILVATRKILKERIYGDSPEAGPAAVAAAAGDPAGAQASPSNPQ